MTDIVFSRSSASRFGVVPISFGFDHSASADFGFKSVRIAARVISGSQLVANIGINTTVCAGVLAFDINLWDGISCAVETSPPATEGVTSSSESDSGVALKEIVSVRDVSPLSISCFCPVNARTQTVLHHNNTRCVLLLGGISTAVPFSDFIKPTNPFLERFNQIVDCAGRDVVGFSEDEPAPIPHRLSFNMVTAFNNSLFGRFSQPRVIDSFRRMRVCLGIPEGIEPRNGKWIHVVVPTGHRDISYLINLCDSLTDWFGVVDVVFGGCEVQASTRIFVPIRRRYFVTSAASLRRVSDDTEIGCSSISVSLNADSWSWECQASVVGQAALDLVRSAGDEPVIVEATINGYLWRFLVESWGKSSVFGRNSGEIRGRSLLALLDEPYRAKRNYTSEENRTAAQLAINELPAGWDIDWGVVDWIVPGGAWSYQDCTPMAAITRLAMAAGGVVVPSRVEQSIGIVPRYPVLPWQYASSPPGIVLPRISLLSEQRRYSCGDGVNAVFVQGGGESGLLGRVYRSGSDGAVIAPTHSEPLAVSSNVVRALGSRILAAHEPQPVIESITTPLGGDFPLAGIGELIRLTDATENVFGIVSGVAVAAGLQNGALVVRQQIRIGENSGSNYGAFTRLLPRDPLLVGVISAVYGDNTVMVTLPGGGALRVRGAGVVDDHVYVRGGQVQGAAPDLPFVEIEV